jgi:hypothetical protein
MMRTPFVRRAALAGTIAYGLYAAGIRPWIHRWDASAQEREEALPGDALIPDPAWVGTRAVTVAVPPQAVWPWLVQMGDGRAGWYSYDRPGAGSSAWHLIPQFEDLEVGSVLHLHPDAALRVVRLEHERALVLSLDPLVGCAQAALAPLARGPAPGPHHTLGLAVTWAFVVKPLPDGGTRFLERVRISVPGDRPGPLILARLAPLGIFLAQRKQLLGIKTRAERAWHGHVEGPVESHVA